MHRRAFTLVELLVVISIIGLLSSIAVVSMSGSRDKARIASGQSFEQRINNALGSSLAAAYDLEEGSGTVVSDVSGNGNNATLSGGPTWVADTNGAGSKYSMNFTGANYITPSRGFGIGNGNFTVALWIKTTSTNGQMYVFSNTGSGNGYRFGLGGGRISFLIGIGANTEGNCGSQVANDGKWHHIAGVFNRTDLLFTCYLDGHELGRIALPSAYVGMSDAAPRIGTSFCCSSFVGQLDNVRVYTQNLSGLSINTLYNEEKKRFALRSGVL